MGSISNNHTSLLVAAHSYSLAPRNPFYPQFINFPKTPFCDLCPLLSSSLINLIANRTPRCVVTAKKKTPSSESVLSPSIVEEVSEDDEFEEFDDGTFLFNNFLLQKQQKSQFFATDLGTMNKN